MPIMPPDGPRYINNYNLLHSLLEKVSYKPGWIIRITEEPNEYAFIIQVLYDAYESENALFTPVSQSHEQASKVTARLLGKTFRNIKKRSFSQKFDYLTLERVVPEDVIRYFIMDTIKKAEMFEFDRWFKVQGL